MLVIISGDRTTLDELFENKLRELMSNTSWAVIREIDFEGDHGRIVFKCSMSDKANLFTEQLRKITTTSELDYNLISDVSVPL